MNKKSAFSLVELAIVISIIGVLVASVSVANNLIRQSELQKLVDHINRYQGAFNNFKLAYSSLPGDMSNASGYWSGARNGDQDAQLEWNYDGPASFIHVSLAEFVPVELSAYTYHSSSNPYTIVGTYVPETAINGVGIGTYYCSSTTCSSTEFLDPNNYFVIGKTSSSYSYNGGGALTGTELYLIDKKLDDGLPGKGTIRNIQTGCVSGEGSTPWDNSLGYDRSNEETDCFFYVELITK